MLWKNTPANIIQLKHCFKHVWTLGSQNKLFRWNFKEENSLNQDLTVFSWFSAMIKSRPAFFSFQPRKKFHMKREKKILLYSSSCMLGMYVCLPRYRQTRYGRNPAVWMKGPPKVKRISRTKKNPNGIIMHSTRPFTTSLYLS